ncbi:hypothetical protein [Micromonospora sp. CPCC 206061]|uniref:hypothetical protein n=1 Tax=Micromonospora sp. CPCC 206061 TaxID=3122410 RepID=UPI002FF18889
MTSPPPTAPVSPPPAAPGPPQASGQWTSLPAAPAPDQFYPPAAPPKKPDTNGFAIASLVFALLGGVLFAVIFGVVAHRRP